VVSPIRKVSSQTFSTHRISLVVEDREAYRQAHSSILVVLRSALSDRQKHDAL
jgi:hypothetical protein